MILCFACDGRGKMGVQTGSQEMWKQHKHIQGKGILKWMAKEDKGGFLTAGGSQLKSLRPSGMEVLPLSVTFSLQRLAKYLKDNQHPGSLWNATHFFPK